MYSVRLYQPSDFDNWNQFVVASKNATFLFDRNFMEYHKDRFEDFSLMVFKNEKLIALLPANKNKNEVFSHQGLTYGGLLLEKNIGVSKIEAIFKSILLFLKDNDVKKITVKQLPYIYHKAPSFELEAFLFNNKAQIVHRNQGFSIDYSLPILLHKTKRKHYSKNLNTDFKIIESTNFKPFWTKILEPRLIEKHSARPVHSLKEITLLAETFPDNIIQFDIYLNQQILAGITIFKDKKVVKSQYGATSTIGEKYRALDFLFISLINKFKDEDFSFFDMGVIAGNYSLLKQKEELGCSQYIQDIYTLNIN